MALRTPLYAEHARLGARLVPFGGWDMPLHYGSQIEEHDAVREHAGMFDVSHMCPIDIEGPGAQSFLRRLLANDVAKLKTVGQALYSCMLNDSGGVVDDLIVYLRGPAGHYRMVVNAATADKDLIWLETQRRSEGFDVEIRRRDDLAMLAVQGPKARDLTATGLPPELAEFALDLPPFHATECGGWFVARTGYTGEDGFEILLPAEHVFDLWSVLLDAGVRPCGLGARDTLRLEAGMRLYGQDMDEDVSPLESGLEWTIAWEPTERDFIGRAALEALRASPERRDFVGLLLNGPGVLRAHQTVLKQGREVGEITSGGFAPTLQRSIALARVVSGLGDRCEVDIRGKPVAARIVKPPFVRHGRILIEL
ncbi:glycine cleavage system aminomethyltransferase GcvT [Thermochromatium tepidum]|uniref:Aminomethyltransferase n=1 Tax=Thermochromatium tepidum ATCC 43061 TaxID=316276 RepID=A0A6I6E6A9_THETI|nr:glycine cleavage system aminomethyltransferase GcvT [Thermochromatium tepidum]QGU32038.1 glycine cleavage system aminomethyltransferase GcvT [Thermochromatium tepidum ATCC 43061]